MKKFLLILVILVVAAASALVYCYAPARAMAVQMMAQSTAWVRAQLSEQQGQTEPHAAKENGAESLPAAKPAAEDAVEPVDGTPDTPAAETVVEPASEVAVEPELPALNAEAEALLPAAEAGDAVAQFNLARQYALGEGMLINQTEFVRWCRTAADQGLPEAQYTMGCCYLRGLGVEANPEEGRRLLESAASLGYAPAAEELKR